MHFNQLILGNIYNYVSPRGIRFPGKIIQVGSSHGFKTSSCLYVLSDDEKVLSCVQPPSVNYTLQLDRFDTLEPTSFPLSHK